MEFKVGDKVKVLPKNGRYHFGESPVKERLAKTGKTVTVNGVGVDSVNKNITRIFTSEGGSKEDWENGTASRYCTFRPSELMMLSRKILIFRKEVK